MNPAAVFGGRLRVAEMTPDHVSITTAGELGLPVQEEATE
jgi:hypothetical protein